MAIAFSRLAIRRDRASRAVARALRTTAFARMPRAERDWVERIEARRAELLRGDGLTGAISPQWMMISLPPLWCRFLIRLVRELRPRSCIELGTGFGLSAAYQAAGLEVSGGGTLETFEGHEDLAGLADAGLGEFGLGHRARIRVGPIEETLAEAAERLAPIELCFVDAEHTEEATLGYFEALLPYLAGGAVVVFDDINWGGVEQAWARIRRHERTSVAVDLQRLGLIVVADP